jgi:hypothetical protein
MSRIPKAIEKNSTNPPDETSAAPRKIPMRFLLLSLLLTLGVSAKERWVYIPANYQVDAEADRVIALLTRAKAAGYDHALITDSKFARLGTVPERYFQNTDRVKKAAAGLKIKLVPAMFQVGYSNNLLFHDPNLAEGLPVKDALFVVRDGKARLQPDPEVRLKGGDMNDRKSWSFADDSLTSEDGAMHSPPTDKNARLHQGLKVSPFRQYHVSVRIRTRGLAGGTPEIKALGKGGKSLQWTNLGVKPDQDWTTHHVTFNSLENEEVSLYFGLWGGHKGDLWWDDAAIEECGLTNLLRRPGAPLTVRRESGDVLKEGRDFEPLLDPLTGTKPWPGEFTAWHEPPSITTHNFPDGTRLRVSFFHPHIIYDGQVCACVEEPAFQELLRDEARRVTQLWDAKSNMMSHDEWRVLGWDESCRKSGRTPGEIAANNLRFCTRLLRDTAPDSRILVWSDMFDPHHNAVADYYLVNGSLDGAWKGLDPAVSVVNWNFDKREKSLMFFSQRGNHQIIAGYYDGPLENVTRWVESARNIPKVDGFMYTTWRNDFTKLEEVSRLLDSSRF